MESITQYLEFFMTGIFQNEERCAIVLFNLGAPDTLNSVHPFLKNLFSDPAILTMPAFFRWCLARLISSLRTPKAKKIYESILPFLM